MPYDKKTKEYTPIDYQTLMQNARDYQDMMLKKKILKYLEIYLRK
jgi:hypothetical protein